MVLELGISYSDIDSILTLTGSIIGKEFPAYEAFIEDNCGNKAFIHTMTSPSEDKLAGELMLPFPDYQQSISLSFPLDNSGCFVDEILVDSNSQSISTWNDINLSKAPADDCSSSPCEGIYPNED